jgi:hypothetical protein
MFISAPISEAAAINAALEAAGKGPNNLSVPMRGDQIVEPGQHTHLGCHWWATDDEVALVRSIQAQVARHSVVRDEPAQLQPRGLFNATFGDFIEVTHKQFPDNRWGWRAVMKVASPDFSPGVRAIAIYTDSDHRQFGYTTGAFVRQGNEWATEWNDGRAARADVHWAVIFAAQREVLGTLPAGQTSAIAYLRFGLPPEDGPTAPDDTPAPWTQPQGAHDAYPLGARVTFGGQTWESTVANNVWAPGVFGWVLVG